MDKETDAKLFSAALYVITNMWADTMGVLQRASLANQIVREIERRYHVTIDEKKSCGTCEFHSEEGDDGLGICNGALAQRTHMRHVCDLWELRQDASSSPGGTKDAG